MATVLIAVGVFLIVVSVLAFLMVMAPKETFALLAVIAVIGFVLFLAILRGYILRDLWEWFMVPLGVKTIGIAWAIGLSCLIGMFIPISKKEDVTYIIVHSVAGALLLWLIGWIIHTHWMPA